MISGPASTWTRAIRRSSSCTASESRSALRKGCASTSTARPLDSCPRCSRSSRARSSSSPRDDVFQGPPRTDAVGSVFVGTKGVIATPHHLASQVGAQILRDGGNAIDAAIAADAVLCVVYPHMTSVGGDLMALVWAAGETSPIGIVGAGRSGELATIEAVRERGHEQMPDRGVLSITVPGTVEAWGRLLERFGSFGLGAVLEPAAGLAQDGHVITAHLADALRSAAALLGREPAAYALYPPM